MIRSALIALGLSAGAASAQGIVPTGPMVDTCGGLRLELAADGTPDADALEAAADVVSARVGGFYAVSFDYTEVRDDRIVVSVPGPFDGTLAALDPVLQRRDFGLHRVVMSAEDSSALTAGPGQSVVPEQSERGFVYLIEDAPILTADGIASASAGLDQNARPGINFSMTEAAAEVFGTYTTQNVGAPFAIVLDGEVVSAPVIQTPIWGGRGMITGAFKVDETEAIAAVLQGGVLPFDLDVVFEEVMDGSDPSADFCP